MPVVLGLGALLAAACFALNGGATTEAWRVRRQPMDQTDIDHDRVGRTAMYRQTRDWRERAAVNGDRGEGDATRRRRPRHAADGGADDTARCMTRRDGRRTDGPGVSHSREVRARRRDLATESAFSPGTQAGGRARQLLTLSPGDTGGTRRSLEPAGIESSDHRNPAEGPQRRIECGIHGTDRHPNHRTANVKARETRDTQIWGVGARGKDLARAHSGRGTRETDPSMAGEVGGPASQRRDTRSEANAGPHFNRPAERDEPGVEYPGRHIPRGTQASRSPAREGSEQPHPGRNIPPDAHERSVLGALAVALVSFIWHVL